MPTKQSTALFSLLAALGRLPLRAQRRAADGAASAAGFIADLRLAGSHAPRVVVQGDAVRRARCSASAGAPVGLLIGDQLSRTPLRAPSPATSASRSRSAPSASSTWPSITIAVLAGVVAAVRRRAGPGPRHLQPPSPSTAGRAPSAPPRHRGVDDQRSRRPRCSALVSCCCWRRRQRSAGMVLLTAALPASAAGC